MGVLVLSQYVERRYATPDRLTERERDVLDLMAQGHINAAIAQRLFLSRSAVEKHANAVFDEPGPGDTAGYSRRVLAVLRYIGR